MVAGRVSMVSQVSVRRMTSIDWSEMNSEKASGLLRE